MAKKSKAAMTAEDMAHGLLKALQELVSGDSLQDGAKAGTKLTGGECTSAQARKLEGYGCAKVVGKQKIGLGYRLEAKATAFGRRVAEAE
jgi:hypothetical protein